MPLMLYEGRKTWRSNPDSQRHRPTYNDYVKIEHLECHQGGPLVLSLGKYVLVATTDSLRPPRPPHDSEEAWVDYTASLVKAKITGIRQHPKGRKDGPKFLIAISWLLSPQEVADLFNETWRRSDKKDSDAAKKERDVSRQLLNSMSSPYELVLLSEHPNSYLELEHVVDTCSVRPYNDTEPLVEWQTHTQWIVRHQLVYRKSTEQWAIFSLENKPVSRCPVDGCNEPYNPWFDVQVYCASCKVWYHCRCLKKIISEGLDPDANELEHILNVPMTRGYGFTKADPPDPSQHWIVVGWQRLRNYCETLISQGADRLPGDWQDVQLFEDDGPVSSGWPRSPDELHERREFAATLLTYLASVDKTLGFECPQEHAL
ncbi:hypothetical protein C8J57DRAFT_1559288 [Mycena rebaudengoi]|nr:hypothetical protein C8J57DRAFT_1559288 [Mycena rebaudengoi]